MCSFYVDLRALKALLNVIITSNFGSCIVRSDELYQLDYNIASTSQIFVV